jgi:hypothetical protein
MLDRMYKEYPKGEAPPALEKLADEFATPTVLSSSPAGWGISPRPEKTIISRGVVLASAAIASYSAGRLSGVRAAAAWRRSPGWALVISGTIASGPDYAKRPRTASRPAGGKALAHAFPDCRRSGVVGGSRQGAAGAEAAAVLSKHVRLLIYRWCHPRPAAI